MRRLQSKLTGLGSAWYGEAWHGRVGQGMAGLILSLVVLGCISGTANAAQFGYSTESPQEFRTVSAQMPITYMMSYDAWRCGDSWQLVLARARAFRKTPVIAWESWNTCYSNYQYRRLHAAPGYSMMDIIKGKQDSYIKAQAKAAKAYKSPIYVRFDHEMNGNWYPWSINSQNFVKMWRHVWTVFHNAGVRNVKWVWTPNEQTAESDQRFDQHSRRLYPGSKYVDIVGTTVSRFLVQGSYYATPAWFFTRLDRLLQYNKPIWVAEATVDLQEMRAWMPAFRQEVDARPWVKAVLWLSTSAQIQKDFGNTNWYLSSQPFARHYLTWKRGYTP